MTRGSLYGPQFERIHRGVYVVRGFEMNLRDRIAAAALALPDDAHLSHMTRIQQLGLDMGPESPLRFTVARDLHVTPRGVFLHRTKVLPPVDPVGVIPAAAYVGVAASMRLLDLIVIGDWLLHHGHMTTEQLAGIAHGDSWRPGAAQSLQLLPYLSARAASPQESRSRAYLVFAGLPPPLVNVRVLDSPDSPIADLWLPEWQLAIEFEGGHHFRDAGQIKRDTWRYAVMRSHGIEYLQVFDAMLSHPIAYVRRVHELLTARGYVGPAPDFGARWQTLRQRVPGQPLDARLAAVGTSGFKDAEP